MCDYYHPLSTDTPRDLKAAFTRRRFLQTGMAVMATSATLPAFLTRAGDALSAQASQPHNAAGVKDGRVLVIVQLSGGNDGLNTVIPFGDSAYHRARPYLGIEDGVHTLDGNAGIGLHPNLGPIYELMAAGRAAVVQGVGYPNPNRSHFASMDIWHTGDPAGGRGKGWIGRALDSGPGVDPAMACISFGADAPLAANGSRVKPVTFEDPDLFRWTGRDLHPALSAGYDRITGIDEPTAAAAATQPAPANESPADFLRRTAMDAQVASGAVRRAVARQPRTRFPGNPLAQQLRSVASMIHAELPTRVYYVTMGGFDTHAGQANPHGNLMAQFAQAMAAFDAELRATGHADRVATLAFSEFGRRVRENASGGTDHGAAGPAFVFGPLRKPGLQGAAPSLTQLDNGDLRHTVDFRHLYAEMVGPWLGLDANEAVGSKYRPTHLIQA